MQPVTTVLWNLNGTLVDSGAARRRAEYSFLGHGLRWDDINSQRLVGGNLERAADVFEVKLGYELARIGVCQGIATSSHRAIAQLVAAGLEWVDATMVISQDDVTAPKPDAEPYPLAADRCGGAPGVVALEDSQTGTASALAAGPLVIVVAPLAPADWPTRPTAHLPSLEGLSRTEFSDSIEPKTLARLASSDD